jgi:hypothetical protein
MHLLGVATMLTLVLVFYPASCAQDEPAGPRARLLRLSMDTTMSFVPMPDGREGLVSPITNEQYQIAVKEGAVPAPRLPEDLDKKKWHKVVWSRGEYLQGQAACAVLFVRIDDAEAYCRWLEKRFPDFHFTLPDDQDEPYVQMSQSEQGTAGAGAYDPRPASGNGAIASKNGFWHAPWTVELRDYRKVLRVFPEAEQKVLKARLAQGYPMKVMGSYRLEYPETLPTSFRVILHQKP